jgi:alkylation response protein AidB-like acyl-CoA dehydrogenase
MSAGLASLPQLTATSIDAVTLVQGVRARARAELPAQVQAIDHDGVYPRETMASLGQGGLFSSHLRAHSLLDRADLGVAIRSMAEVAAECMSTGFCTWCQDASGWYLENTENTTLRDKLQGGIATGAVMAGTGMSNPMKTLSGIEGFKLRAQRVAGGYVVSGVLPWVSNLGQGHWFATVIQDADDAGHQMFAMVQCGQPGVEIRQNARFIALEGTGTYSVLFRKAFIADEMMLADPLGDAVKRILPGVIMLQTGMGLGVIEACIGLMNDSNRSQAASNQYLPRGPSYYEDAKAELMAEIVALAATPTEFAPEFRKRVLTARLRTSEMALDAAQSALLHSGSKGYLQGSPVNRRLRESYFVAIITPSIRHLRKELAALAQH